MGGDASVALLRHRDRECERCEGSGCEPGVVGSSPLKAPGGELPEIRKAPTVGQHSEEVLREFGVGFAPSAWDQVLTRGQKAGYSVDEMQAAGLVDDLRVGGVARAEDRGVGWTGRVDCLLSYRPGAVHSADSH